MQLVVLHDGQEEEEEDNEGHELAAVVQWCQGPCMSYAPQLAALKKCPLLLHPQLRIQI